MRQFVLALAVFAGCGRSEPDASPGPPAGSSAPTSPAAQAALAEVAAPNPPPPKPFQEEPIVRRSKHVPQLETFTVELKSVVAPHSDLIAFVDVPANLEARAKSLVEPKASRQVVTVTGAGDATLYVLSTDAPLRFAKLAVTMDRRNRIVSVEYSDFRRLSGGRRAPVSGSLSGYGARLGALEAGSWVVQVVDGHQETTWFTFVAGTGGPEPKGVAVDRKHENDLPAFLTWPGAELEHGLIAFVSKESDFESARSAELGDAKAPKPALLVGGDDLVLYVLWGRRIAWPDASAEFDRKSSTFWVSARWTGGGGMKEMRKAPYAGYGFKLGRLEAGTYSVEVHETVPTSPGDRPYTKKISFEVRARP